MGRIFVHFFFGLQAANWNGYKNKERNEWTKRKLNGKTIHLFEWTMCRPMVVYPFVPSNQNGSPFVGWHERDTIMGHAPSAPDVNVSSTQNKKNCSTSIKRNQDKVSELIIVKQVLHWHCHLPLMVLQPYTYNRTIIYKYNTTEPDLLSYTIGSIHWQ